MSDLEYTGERVVPGKVDRTVWYEHMARYLVAAEFVKGRRVLDAGCGAGYGSDLLAARGAESVLAIDVAPDAVAYARRRYARANLRYEVADVTRMAGSADVGGRAFDVVVSFEVIEHLDDTDGFLAAVSELLAPNGVFIVSTPDRTAYRPLDEPNPYHTREFDLGEYRELLGRHFPHVRILSEHYLGGVAIDEADPSGDLRVAARLLRPDAYHRYFIAVCGNQSLPDVDGVPRILPFSAIDWDQYLAAAARELDGVVEAGAAAVLIDGGSCDAAALMPGRRVVPLIERAGQDWGAPTDDAQAIEALEGQRDRGAAYVVIAQPAFWWLDHYAGFAEHLHERYPAVLRNERLVVFDVRTQRAAAPVTSPGGGGGGAPATCPCCGGRAFVRGPVLWPALVEEWRLSPAEAEYVDRQQGLRCGECGSSLRSMALAAAVMRCFGYAGRLVDFVMSHQARWLRVLEVNEAGQLTQFLSRIPGHVIGRYPEVDMTALPYGDTSFDLVVHSDTLEHVPDPVKGLSECRRVLRAGGFCAFTVPIVVGRLSASRAGKPPSYHGDPSQGQPDYLVHTEYGADAWRHVVEAGFAECRIVSIDFPAAQALVGVSTTSV